MIQRNNEAFKPTNQTERSYWKACALKNRGSKYWTWETIERLIADVERLTSEREAVIEEHVGEVRQLEHNKAELEDEVERLKKDLTRMRDILVVEMKASGNWREFNDKT